MSDILEIGDIVVTETFLGESKYPITRVTKTLGFSKRGDNYEHVFKRKIQWDMSHPRQEWNTTKYSVIKVEKRLMEIKE